MRAMIGDMAAIATETLAGVRVVKGFLGEAYEDRRFEAQSLEVLRMEPVPGAAQPRDEALLVGSSRPQRAILRVKALGEHPISLLERRTWEPSNESARFRLTIVAEGVPERGLSPKQRQALIRA